MSSYVVVSGAIGLPEPYASSSCRATSSRVTWSTGAPRSEDRGGPWSQLQLQPRAGRPRDADQHPVHGRLLLPRQHEIAVVDRAGDDRGEARPADPVATVVLHLDAEGEDLLEDVGFRGEPEGVT